eukprot:9295620-Alexandrium_andersonii.AAC.1
MPESHGAQEGQDKQNDRARHHCSRPSAVEATRSGCGRYGCTPQSSWKNRWRAPRSLACISLGRQ